MLPSCGRTPKVVEPRAASPFQNCVNSVSGFVNSVLYSASGTQGREGIRDTGGREAVGETGRDAGREGGRESGREGGGLGVRDTGGRQGEC